MLLFSKRFKYYIGAMRRDELKKAQTTVQFLLGPIKIKDGLFLGDQLAAKDIEFIISNKVTHVINTVSKVVPNLYERFGVQYLSVHWAQKQQNIFDKKNNAVSAICDFIQQAMEQGQSCLIHSVHGKSRSTAVLVAYLMKKYGWTLSKCLELVSSKKQGLQVRNNYLKQMQELEKRLMETRQLNGGWSQTKNQEELLLVNTFVNAKKAEAMGAASKKGSRKKVSWDQKLVHRVNPNMGSSMTRFKEQAQQQPSKKVEPSKSILKGCPNPHQNQGQETPVKKEFKLEGDQKLINNINGNIVHVTVNNFITTQKKPSDASKTFNSRPYSSDVKEREKKEVRKVGYQTFGGGLRSAYEQKVMGSRVGSKSGTRKKDEQKFNAADRPLSANNQEVKKPKPLPFSSLLGREQMVITGSSGTNNNAALSGGLVGKRRYPSGSKQDGRFK